MSYRTPISERLRGRVIRVLGNDKGFTVKNGAAQAREIGEKWAVGKNQDSL